MSKNKLNRARKLQNSNHFHSNAGAHLQIGIPAIKESFSAPKPFLYCRQSKRYSVNYVCQFAQVSPHNWNVARKKDKKIVNYFIKCPHAVQLVQGSNKPTGSIPCRTQTNLLVTTSEKGFDYNLILQILIQYIK